MILVYFLALCLIDIAGHLRRIVSLEFLFVDRGEIIFFTRMDCIYLGQKVRVMFMSSPNFSQTGVSSSENLW